ncbi:MAG: HAMP domain-containing protein [Clostridium sp.]|nr:HAMP domain-containing protein [Clostridium sp.]
MFKSISKKLTFVITALMTLLLLGSMIFMTVSFESFYRRAKLTSLTENLEQFSTKAKASEDIFIQAINDFETDNNSRLFIFGENGTLEYLPFGGNQVEGDYIEIINSFFKDLVQDSVFQKRLLQDKKIISRDYQRQDGSIRYFLTATAIERNDQRESLAISISSMLPINEAARTIKNVFTYVFIGGFVVIILLATLISNTITKPLRKLTQSSKELAKLNFDVPVDFNQNDEIGELGLSLSTLSKNLSEALLELKEKNILLNKDLVKRKEMEDQRKTFIRDISHELKTPITLIQGYTEGLIDGISEENKEEYLSIILDESKNMEILVKDMIELSYTESDAYTLTLEPFNLSQTLYDNISPFLDYHSNGIKVQIDLTPNLYILGDKMKLTTAFRNIIKNAMIHTDEHGKVTISLEETPLYYSFKVNNSPAHIDEDELKNIWVEFYKKDKSRTRKTGSSGLGLSIIKNILDLHKLTYDLSNEKDGVSFSILFPKPD